MKHKILVLLVVLLLLPQSVSAFDWDPEKWIFCNIHKAGPDILKATRTDLIPFLQHGKSVIGSQDSKDNFYNSILKASGYKIGDLNLTYDNINPFDKFGMSGLKWTSYRGEFKYFNVNPCGSGDRQFARTTNYGQFYETRKEPLATHGESAGSLDIRTKVYNEGFSSAFGKSLFDTIANSILALSKFVVTLLLAFLSLALSDISNVIGFNLEKQIDIVLKLYQGLFLPLLTIMVIFSGCYIFYYGIIKREYRTALINGIAKTTLAIFIGLLIGNNPSLIAIPNNLVVLGQSAIISAISQDNGTNDTSFCQTSRGIKNLDNITDPEFLNNATDNLKSILACQIWSEFIMKPVVRGQFGMDYENLDDLKNENSLWVGEPTVYLGEKEVKNWGLFYISVLSGEHTPVDKVHSPLVGRINKDYYRIIDAISNYEETFTLKDEETGKETKVNPVDNIKLDYTKGYPEVKITTPHETWNYFIGNKNQNRITYGFMIFIFAVIGSIPLLFIAIMSASLGLGITILVTLSPIFLLLGVWGGKGNSIMLQYFGTLLSLILKRIFVVLVLLLGIAFTTATMKLVNEIGFAQTLVFSIVSSIIIYKNRAKILDQLARVNIGKLGTSGFQNTIQKVKNATKLTASVGMSATFGGISSKMKGGSFVSGAGAGAESYIKDRLYTSRLGRKAMAIYETTVKSDLREKGKFCINCHTKLEEDKTCYVDSNNNYWCNDCASAESYTDMEEILMDNEIDDKFDLNKTEIEIDTDNGTSTKQYLNYKEASELKKRLKNSDDSYTKEEISNLIKSRVQDCKDIFDNQIKNFDSSSYNQIGKVYIPEPIKHYISPKDLRKYIVTNDYKKLQKVFNEAWDKWESSTLKEE